MNFFLQWPWTCTNNLRSRSLHILRLKATFELNKNFQSSSMRKNIVTIAQTDEQMDWHVISIYPQTLLHKWQILMSVHIFRSQTIFVINFHLQNMTKTGIMHFLQWTWTCKNCIWSRTWYTIRSLCKVGISNVYT